MTIQRTTRRPALARAAITFAAAGALATLPGCAAGQLLGGMAQNFEYQKKIEVLPEYDDLEARTVAVIVLADPASQFEHPDLVARLTNGIAADIQSNVPEVQVLTPRAVLQWQFATPQWEVMPYGEIADRLNVERIVFVDLYEYRLNPPGNSWLWEGVCAATIGIVERESFDPDTFSETFNVVSEYPGIRGTGRESASAQQIALGLQSKFVNQASRLFYKHIRPKYPDQYRPELDTPS